MTIPKCIEFCKSKNKLYAGLQNGYACFCGDDPGVKTDLEKCKTACKGDKRDLCGGPWYNSVYVTNPKDVNIRCLAQATLLDTGKAARYANGSDACQEIDCQQIISADRCKQYSRSLLLTNTSMEETFKIIHRSESQGGCFLYQYWNLASSRIIVEFNSDLNSTNAWEDIAPVCDCSSAWDKRINHPDLLGTDLKGVQPKNATESLARQLGSKPIVCRGRGFCKA